MPEFQTVRGMRDFLPKEAATMKYVEGLTRELAGLYGFQEIITPIMESYELLAAKSGEEIRQRMYIFEDLGGRKMALRPEFTASIARLLASTMRNEPKPLRLYCVGSLYRYDEPQFGRYREFWQSNYELFGTNKPEADVEILALTNDLFRRIGLRNYHFKIGHVGIVRGILSEENVKEEDQNRIMQLLDKKQWNDALTLAKELNVSEKCLTVLKKIFETKGEDASKVLKEIEKTVKDYAKATSAVENLKEIITLLENGEINLNMTIEAGFARGLEYYTGMVYEIDVPELDVALSGGGRYDRLIELFGGEHTPAVGIAHGIDRITLAMEKQNTQPKTGAHMKIMLICIGEEPKGEALKIASTVRNMGVTVELEVMGRNVNRALQDANRKGITHVLILGPEEMKKKEIILKDLRSYDQSAEKASNIRRIIRQSIEAEHKVERILNKYRIPFQKNASMKIGNSVMFADFAIPSAKNPLYVIEVKYRLSPEAIDRVAWMYSEIKSRLGAKIILISNFRDVPSETMRIAQNKWDFTVDFRGLWKLKNIVKLPTTMNSETDVRDSIRFGE